MGNILQVASSIIERHPNAHEELGDVMLAKFRQGLGEMAASAACNYAEQY